MFYDFVNRSNAVNLTRIFGYAEDNDNDVSVSSDSSVTIRREFWTDEKCVFIAL